MKEAAFPNLGTVLTHDSWQEQAAHAYCLIVDACYEEGIKISQAETSDLTAAETDFSALSDYLKTWMDGNIDLSAQGDSVTALNKSYIPELGSFAFLAATGQWGLVFVLFCKVGLEFLLDFGEKKLDPDVSTGDMVEVIKQVMAYLDESGNIVGSRLDGLSNLQLNIHTGEEAREDTWAEIS